MLCILVQKDEASHLFYTLVNKSPEKDIVNEISPYQILKNTHTSEVIIQKDLQTWAAR